MTSAPCSACNPALYCLWKTDVTCWKTTTCRDATVAIGSLTSSERRNKTHENICSSYLGLWLFNHSMMIKSQWTINEKKTMSVSVNKAHFRGTICVTLGNESPVFSVFQWRWHSYPWTAACPSKIKRLGNTRSWTTGTRPADRAVLLTPRCKSARWSAADGSDRQVE